MKKRVVLGGAFAAILHSSLVSPFQLAMSARTRVGRAGPSSESDSRVCTHLDSGLLAISTRLASSAIASAGWSGSSSSPPHLQGPICLASRYLSITAGSSLTVTFVSSFCRSGAYSAGRVDRLFKMQRNTLSRGNDHEDLQIGQRRDNSREGDQMSDPDIPAFGIVNLEARQGRKAAEDSAILRKNGFQRLQLRQLHFRVEEPRYLRGRELKQSEAAKSAANSVPDSSGGDRGRA